MRRIWNKRMAGQKEEKQEGGPFSATSHASRGHLKNPESNIKWCLMTHWTQTDARPCMHRGRRERRREGTTTGQKDGYSSTKLHPPCGEAII